MKQKESGQSGNILLIVLIAIALFAALMFFISRDKGSGDAGTTENAAMYAQQITSYAEKLHGAVQSVLLQNNCLATQVSFQDPAGDYVNGTSNLCKVFDLNGGGQVYQTPPAQAVDTAAATAAGSALAGSYYFEGNACVTNAGTGPATANGVACSSANSEILFVMPFVTQSVCAQINQIAHNSTAIPTVSADAFDGTKFTGTFAGTYTIATGATTYPSGCFQITNASKPGTGYHFYAVLSAR